MKKILMIFSIILLVIVLLIAFIPNLKLMAEITYMNLIEITQFDVDESNPENLLMNGVINSKTFKQLKAVMNDHPEIKTIVLVDVPGSLDDETNFEMCYWIREKGLKTYITKDSHVASGGTDFFLSGVERLYEEGAKVGVHSWQDSSGIEAKDLPKTHEDHEMNRKYIEDMLGTDDFYWYTIYAADADDIYYMTPKEIGDFGMYTLKIQ